MRLLVVPGFSTEFGSANTNCLNELITALNFYQDLEVTVTGATLKKENASNKNLFWILKKVIHWPVMNPDVSQETYNQICKELKSKQYDGILVGHMPYDGVLAAIRAKRKFQKVKLFLYEMDPITYEIDKQRKSLGRYLYFLRVLAEKRTFRTCDKIFHMECNRSKYETKKYDKYASKSVYMDFPLIHNRGEEVSDGMLYEGQTIKLLYTGKLMSYFRSPEYLLKVLAEVKKSINIEVIFFSKGDCEDMIENFSREHAFIRQCGYVDSGTLQKELDSCDGLINIGNKISDMLPSKLLTYIETGKMILHVKNQENDACISYLERYSLAQIIDESDSIAANAKKLIVFLKKNYGKKMGSKEIVEAFQKNTPEYSAEIVYQSMLEDNIR